MLFLIQWWKILNEFSWNHPFRRGFRNGDSFDPQIGFWFGGGGIVFMLFCAGMLGTFDLGDNQESGMETLCACAMMVSPLLGIIFGISFWIGPVNYVKWIKELGFFLACPLLGSANMNTYEQIAHSKLTKLAQEVKALEADGEPYYRECVQAKATFEYYYKFALRANLIQDVGYKPFFAHG